MRARKLERYFKRLTRWLEIEIKRDPDLKSAADIERRIYEYDEGRR